MKKYIIAITLFCISFILIDDAYALTGDYASSNFQIFTYDSPEGGTRTSSGYSSGLNVSQYLNGAYLEGLYIQVFGNDDIVYEAGNTYTFVFKVNFNPKKWKYLDNTFTTSNLKVFGSKTSSSTNMSTENITASSLSIADVDGNTYQMIYTFKVVPEVNLKYLLFQCFYPYGLLGADLNYVYNLDTVRVVDLSVTYEQGVGAIVDQQTTVIQNSTNQILNSQQQTNDKLDETNKELGEVKDEIKNQFENCKEIIPTLKNKLNASMYYNTSSGKIQIESQENLNVYIYEVEKFGNYTFKFLNYNRLRVYLSDTLYTQLDLPINISGSMIINNDSPTINETYTINVNKKYIYMYLSGDSNTEGEILFESNGEVCSNRIDETNQQLQQTNDFLTSDEAPNSDISALGNVQGLLPPGPVDSLLNIPFYFLSVVNSSMGGVCVPISGKFVFDSTLTLPCFGELFYDNVPAYLMNFISLIPGAWLLIKYLKHLYKKVNRAVSMESNADDEWGVL